MNNIDNYNYQKIYKYGKNGCLILQNPKYALEYALNMSKQLCENFGNTDIIRNVKLEIINDFKRIYQYDVKKSIYPEPFGTFNSDKEKKDFIKRKILTEDFYLYLGNIFSTYHTYLIQYQKPLPMINFPTSIIDYNEIYVRAIDEYLLILNNESYPHFKIKNEIHRDIINNYINITNGKTEEIPNNQTNSNIIKPIIHKYVYGTAYMLPSLIEKCLIINIKTKLFHSCMDTLKELLDHNVIKLNIEENYLYNIFIKKGNKFLSEDPYTKMYQLFIKYHIISENKDNELILTGKSNGKEITLGNIFFSKYIQKVLKPEYMYLLDITFNSDKLNIRNSIMHGDNLGCNYFEIGFSSVILQLLWDICSNDVFIDNKI